MRASEDNRFIVAKMKAFVCKLKVYINGLTTTYIQFGMDSKTV